MAKRSSKNTITIKDVAAETGLSPSTISKVLSGNYPVNPQTSALVHEAAQRLGYVPDVSARNLRLGRTGQIGIVLNEIQAQDPSMAMNISELQMSSMEIAQISFDGAVLAGVTNAVRRHKSQSLVIFPQPPQGQPDNETRYLDGRVDGLLVRTDPRCLDRLVDRLDGSRVPVVALWAQHVPDNMGYVDIDHHHGGYLVGQHLASLNLEHVVYYGEGIESSNSHFAQRHQGFLDALTKSTLQVSQLHQPQQVAQLIQQHRGKIGVFTPSDLQCALFVQDMKAFDIKVPTDVCLAGFDDIFGADFIAGGLTTVYHPVREMADMGAEQLLALIDGQPPEACRVVIKPRLVVRHSTRQ